MSHVNKIAAERNLRTLLDLVNQPGNDVCADCKARHPRWASHNLGIFICLPCASIHRKMGTHISKVKSVTLDSWSKEQVEFMKDMGNVKSNAIYNPNERRHPPPTNMMESERDSELEKFIRAKYEYKSFMDRSTQVSAQLGPSRSSSGGLSTSRSSSSTLDASRSAKVAALLGPSRSASSRLSRAQTVPVVGAEPSTSSAPSAPAFAVSQSQIRPASQPASVPPAQAPPQRSQPTSSTPLWNDLASLQAPAANSSLPLQYATPSVSLPALAPPNPNTDLTMRPPMAPPMSAMNVNMGGGASPLLPMQSFTPTMASSINPFSQQAAYASQQPTYSPQPAFTPQVQPQGSPMFQPQGSPMFQSQASPVFQPQSSPMFQSQQLGPSPLQIQIPLPPAGNPFLQPQPLGQTSYGQPPPSPFTQPQMQMQPQMQSQMQPQMQQSMFTPTNPFSAWPQQQQGGFPGQHWGGM